MNIKSYDGIFSIQIKVVGYIHACEHETTFTSKDLLIISSKTLQIISVLNFVCLNAQVLKQTFLVS